MQLGIECAAEQVQAGAPAERTLAEEVADLVAVTLPPVARVKTQPARRSRSLRSGFYTHPFSTSGGITPGSPSATGNGPRVNRDVSTNSTPCASTRTAYRFIPCGAGP